MVTIAFAIYRQWGYEIFKKIVTYQKKRQDFIIKTLVLADSYNFQLDKKYITKYNPLIINPNDTQSLYKIFTENKTDIICFYSWSFMVRQPLLNDFTCLCLHPSKLPLYRGGTPLQHQIINGVTKSAVTIFKMSEGIDAGDIYKQKPLLLTGDINDIFSRMVTIGTKLTEELIVDATNNKLRFKTQKNLLLYPPNKRRVPSESEIDIESLPFLKFKDINNLVRSLTDPYPNAFIILSSKRLLLQKILFVKHVPSNSFILKKDTLNNLTKDMEIYLPLQKGYAKVLKYKIE